MRIVSFGDIHMATGQIERLAGELSSADLALISGDLTNFGGERETMRVLAAIRDSRPQLLAIPGNLDKPEVIDCLKAQGVSLHGEGQQCRGVSFFGCGGSNITPFRTPTELEEGELERLLKQGYDQVNGQRPLLMLSHTPPYGTRVDRLRDGRHVGSPAVRDFIERHQPDVCVSGHVHEATGIDRLGLTTLVNAGPLRDGGYIVIVVAEGEQASVELLSL